MDTAARGMQNQKVPSPVGFTSTQANGDTETPHCCSVKGLSPNIWAQYPERGGFKAFYQISVLVSLPGQFWDPSGEFHDPSPSVPHFQPLHSTRGMLSGCLLGFFNLLPRSSFISWLFIWVYCLPCWLCRSVYSVPQAAETRHQERKYRTINYYLHVLWNKPRKSLRGEGGIRLCLFPQRQF